ncbi:MAG: type I-B CRISPR-associated endonuclease Cas1b [Candidatus Rehaiarchaeum fermentans]|nr:type I-B CRISPR-associated endonuclease Cas1b [Candidatus Rehaiarchaeum fermentans]
MNKDYYIFSNGRLKRNENTISFENSQGETKSLPIENIETIHLFGEIDFNTKLLTLLSEYGIILNTYNYYGYYTGSFCPRKNSVSGYLLVQQAKNYIDPEKRFYIAYSFISSAIFHMKRNLRNYGLAEQIKKIEQEENLLVNIKGIENLMGIEGNIREIYYHAFNSILSNHFQISKREKHPPTDPVNALISFGNSLMYTSVLGEIYKTQIDPTLSFLHEPSTKRFSLSLDIAEIFKPLIIDPIIFKLVNERMITLDYFDIDKDICFLNKEGKMKFISEYDKKLRTTVRHRKLGRNVSYRYLIRIECYKLIKHFIGDDVYKPLKAWW